MLRRASVWLVSMALLALAACAGQDGAVVPEEGEVVDAPFDVRGEAEGLLLVWYDAEGAHTATSRAQIPEAHRERVRIDDLSAAPEERLDPELVYVADLREAGGSGEYTVRRMPRAAFDRLVESAGGSAEAAPVEHAATDGDVVIYGASWCQACRGAAAYLRERNVPFVERDVEREPGAREAMQRAAQAAGVATRGIPVIDFRGEIIPGFDRGRLEAAIGRTRTAI